MLRSKNNNNELSHYTRAIGLSLVVIVPWKFQMMSRLKIKLFSEIRYTEIKLGALLLLFYLISSLTPRLDRKFFIECHDVSAMPISRSTPSSTSRTTSGGALNERTYNIWSQNKILSIPKIYRHQRSIDSKGLELQGIYSDSFLSITNYTRALWLPRLTILVVYRPQRIVPQQWPVQQQLVLLLFLFSCNNYFLLKEKYYQTKLSQL